MKIFLKLTFFKTMITNALFPMLLLDDWSDSDDLSNISDDSMDGFSGKHSLSPVRRSNYRSRSRSRGYKR